MQLATNATFGPNNLARIQKKYAQIKTIEDAINSDSWSIAKTRKDYGESKLRNMIGSMLMQLNELTGVSNKLTKEQIIFIVDFIFAEMWMLKIADLIVLFRDVAAGRYGELYNSMSTDKLCRWFTGYLDSRMVISENRSQLKHVKALETTKEPLKAEKLNQLYSQFKQNETD